MPSLTVLTPTCRPLLGLEQVKKSLKRQTFKDFEWIIISPINLYEPEAIVLQDPPKEEGDYWTFNKAINRAIEKSKGELIVSVQDYTEFIPEGLEKFWYFFKNGYDRALISGVGDKFNESGQLVWADPRKRLDQGSFYECYPHDWEANYGSAPRKMFYDIGGFDEYLDKKAGMDNVSVVERASALGYKFYLDQTNLTKSLVHDRLPDWDKEHAMHGFYQDRKQQLIASGVWPKLNYLNG